MKNILKRACPLLMAVAIIFACAVGASADVLVRNVEDMEYELIPADVGYTLALTLDPAWNYYERYLDGSLRYTAIGETVTWNSQERLLDNIDFTVYPLGQGYMMSASGINVASYWESVFYFRFKENTEISQDFNITIETHLDLYDEDGTLQWSAPNSSYTWTRATTDGNNIRYIMDTSFNPEQSGYASSNMDGWYFVPYYTVSLSGIADEDVTTNVNFTIGSETTLNLPVSQSYGDKLQSDETNSLLGDISSGLTESNGTINSILEKTESNNQLLGDINDGIGETNDHLDQIINGQVDPEAPSGGQEIQDAFQEEEELVTDSFAGFQEFQSFEESFFRSIELYSVTFLALSAFLNTFMTVPIIEQLLSFSVSLGVLAVLLNILPSFGNRPHRKAGDD